MDVARAFHRALNAADLDAMIGLYHPACVVEHVWLDGHDVVEGREAVRGRWADELARFVGALAAGHRVDVTRVAGIETGWGWVRAEWVRSVRPAAGGPDRAWVGYSHFWVEDGLIRRHRTIAEPVDAARLTAEPKPASERRYPTRPLVGVGGVVVSDAGEVLIVKRRQEPLAGQWSLPGGMLELGETLEAATAREMLEETGLVVSVGPVVEVFDRILLDDTGRVRYHFVLIDYLCRVRGGALEAGSDVEAAAFVSRAALPGYRLTDKAQDVIDQAFRMIEAGAPGLQTRGTYTMRGQ
jgi:ADP-ribose pyrophosphatase YjhB (NUDIX family)/ketosteroid isomerase-like protein